MPLRSLFNAVRVLTLFGTRPEVIKVSPVISALEAQPESFTTINVSSSQHTDLLQPLIRDFAIRLDHDLKVMQPNQTLSSLSARVLIALDPVLLEEKPDIVLVQGDTTTALAGALAAFHRHIPVGHIEAGLRSGNSQSPFPEEMNRRLISRIAKLHFAATRTNYETLLSEGIDPGCVALTGNTVVDALLKTARTASPTPATQAVLDQVGGKNLILLTTHRRESFGERMSDNLKVLREFVRSHPEASLVFPMHPNPAVSGPAREILGQCERVHLIAPLDYQQFVLMMSRAWLIVSDSGGVQEESPTLGKPLLVLRENTERSEAVDAGCAKLTGTPELLRDALDEACSDNSWIRNVKKIANPFGDGKAAEKIAESDSRKTDAGRKSRLDPGLSEGFILPIDADMSGEPKPIFYPRTGTDPDTLGLSGDAAPLHDRPLVSLVIPAYNEAAIVEKNLAVICNYMQSLESKYDWEMIIVNDGSKDNTSMLAKAFAATRTNIFVLDHAVNFGLGQALKFAFNECHGDYIVTVDMDLSYSPDHIERLLDTLVKTRAKIVIASPYLAGGAVENVPEFRRILSVGANKFLSIASHGRIKTLTGMVRAYDARFLKTLDFYSMGMEVNSEILYKAMVLRARIEEIPAVLKWHLPDPDAPPAKPVRQIEHADRKVCRHAAGVGFSVSADHVFPRARRSGAGDITRGARSGC